MTNARLAGRIEHPSGKDASDCALEIPPATSLPRLPASHRLFGLPIPNDYEAMSRAAADFMAAEIRAKPTALLCLAGGTSPSRAYELLATYQRTEPRLFDNVRLLKLDEWGDLPMDDPATCEVYLRQKLVGPLRIGPDRFTSWDSQASDPLAECRRMTHWLSDNGPIDLTILGVGANGHLGLNEPADELPSGPHLAELSEISKTHPMLGKAKCKAWRGYTLGVGDILKSRKILLVVSGAHKAEQMGRFFSQRISTRFPASLLWLHPALTILCDRAALSRLPKDLLP